jgi:hypothetical protein
MSGFSTLRRIRTRKHIRTMRSIPTNLGPDRALWLRPQEIEWQGRKEKRQQARQRSPKRTRP